LELGVVKSFLKKVPIEGEGGYGAGTEAGEDCAREGYITSDISLLLLSFVCSR
jgi:hypothetical protein